MGENMTKSLEQSNTVTEVINEANATLRLNKKQLLLDSEHHYVNMGTCTVEEMEQLCKHLYRFLDLSCTFSFILHVNQPPDEDQLTRMRSNCNEFKTQLMIVPESKDRIFVVSPTIKELTSNVLRFLVHRDTPTPSWINVPHCWYLSSDPKTTDTEIESLTEPQLLTVVIYKDTGQVLYVTPSPDIELLTKFQVFLNFAPFETILLRAPPTTFAPTTDDPLNDWDYCMGYVLEEDDLLGFVKFINGAARLQRLGINLSLILSIGAWRSINLAIYAAAYIKFVANTMGVTQQSYTTQYSKLIYLYNYILANNNNITLKTGFVKLITNANETSTNSGLMMNIHTGEWYSIGLTIGDLTEDALYRVEVVGKIKGKTVKIWNFKRTIKFDTNKLGQIMTVCYIKKATQLQALRYMDALVNYNSVLLFGEWSMLFSKSDILVLMEQYLRNFTYFNVPTTTIGGLVYSKLTINSNTFGAPGSMIDMGPSQDKVSDTTVAAFNGDKFDVCPSNRIVYYPNESCFLPNSDDDALDIGSNNNWCTLTLNAGEINRESNKLKTTHNTILVVCHYATAADLIDSFDYIIHYRENYKFLFVHIAAANTAFTLTSFAKKILDAKCTTHKFGYSPMGALGKYQYFIMHPIEEIVQVLGEEEPSASPKSRTLTVNKIAIMGMTALDHIIDHSKQSLNPQLDLSIGPMIVAIGGDYVQETENIISIDHVESTGVEYVYHKEYTDTDNVKIVVEQNSDPLNQILDTRRVSLFSISLDPPT